MRCRKLRKTLPEYLYGGMKEEDKRGVVEHAAACSSCRETISEMEKLIPFLKSAPRPAFTPQEMAVLRSRVREEVSRRTIVSPVFRKGFVPWLILPHPAVRLAAAAGIVLLFGAAIYFHRNLGANRFVPETGNLVVITEAVEEEIESMAEMSQEVDFLQSLSPEEAKNGPEAGFMRVGVRFATA